jgi:hypothetical protein
VRPQGRHFLTGGQIQQPSLFFRAIEAHGDLLYETVTEMFIVETLERPQRNRRHRAGVVFKPTDLANTP